MACTHITVGHYVEWFLGPSWALISILIFIVYFEVYYYITMYGMPPAIV